VITAPSQAPQVEDILDELPRNGVPLPLGVRRSIQARKSEGYSNRAIAREFGIHHRTVAKYLETPPTPAEQTDKKVAQFEGHEWADWTKAGQDLNRKASWSQSGEPIFALGNGSSPIILVTFSDQHIGADEPDDPVADPATAGIGIFSGQFHGGQIPAAQVATPAERSVHVHAILHPCGLEEAGGDPRPKAAQAEVNTDLDPVALVREQIAIMIAGADGPELRLRLLLQRPRGGNIPSRVSVAENRMIDPLVVLAANAAADDVPDVVHHGGDVGEQFSAFHVQQDRLVAAADVVAHFGGADGILVSHHTAEGHAVANLIVRDQGAI